MIDLVLVPGLLCTDTLWEHQINHLGDVARVSVADVSSADNMPAMADAILAASPPQFALCGLSMGGIIAHEIMRKAPERILKLALLDTNARPDTPDQTERRNALLEMVDRGAFAQVPIDLMPALVHPDRVRDITLTTALCTMAATIGPEVFRRQINAIITRPDSRPGLAKYACPTLVLCGREDAVTPLELHEEMAGGIAGAKLAVVEQCGHIATMERPQAVTALLHQWLRYE